MKRVCIVVALALLTAGSAYADFQAGLQAYNNKDFATAVSTWEKEASTGDLNSQYNLGVLYETGVDGYPKDLSIAYSWYRLAASQDVGAAEKALERIIPIMTAGQIEDGNNRAIEFFGKWYRKNIGRNEQEYQAAKVALEKDRKAKIVNERLAAAARAERQRDLIKQRDADAKLANNLQRESRQAAIKAAQEKAEEAKRQAFIIQRRKEEEARLTSLRTEKEKQDKVAVARIRLAELKAKQQGAQPQIQAAQPEAQVAQPIIASTPEVAPTPKVASTSPTPIVAVKPASVAVTTAPAPTAVQTADVPAAQTSAVKAPVTKTPVKKAATPIAVAPKQEPIAPAAEEAAAPKPIASQPVVKPPQPTVKVEKPEPAAVATRKPFKATSAPSTANVAQKPTTVKKILMPEITNGLDVMVLKEIVEAANAVPLDTAVAKQEIDKARSDIQALQWSLISAARGKGSAKRMNDILKSKMTVVQIAEANRRAALWIDKRQKRQ